VITVTSAQQMRDLGERLAARLRPGDLLILSGPLGAGKTTLVQGIAAGLGVRGPITSPTFVIARVHPSLVGGPALVHADAYRLGGAAELDDLDLDADTDSSITVVEWGEGLAEGLADDRLEITINRGQADDGPRTVTVIGVGERWADQGLPTTVETSALWFIFLPVLPPYPGGVRDSARVVPVAAAISAATVRRPSLSTPAAAWRSRAAARPRAAQGQRATSWPPARRRR
jgi:tRNA threonylcarbamoyladenosine biosynthesis protein TsaE